MRIRALMVVLVLLVGVGAVSAQGFYAGAGVDIFLSNADGLDAGGYSSTFIGFTPKVGYQINQMWGVNAGYKYYMTNKGDGDNEFTQSAISIDANIAPFKDGGLMPLYFIVGVDMVSYEVKSSYTFFGTTVTAKADDSETDIGFGAGYAWMMGDKFSINPEVTYLTGDAGGINIEVGFRYHF